MAGKSVKVKVNLRRDGKTVNTFEATGRTDNLPDLVTRVVDGISQGVQGLQP